MKVLKKAMALFLAMLMVLAVAPAAFADEVAEDVVVPDVEVGEEGAEEALNPFAFIGMFFESIATILRNVVEFLENMFSGSAGNDALENLK